MTIAKILFVERVRSANMVLVSWSKLLGESV